MDRRSFLASLIDGPGSGELRPEDAPKVDSEALEKAGADYAQ